jgi:hypothetical protein
MGGVLIVLSTVIPTLLWAELTNGFTVTALVVLLWLGALGFMDDYLKVVRKKTEGLIGRYKIVGQARSGCCSGCPDPGPVHDVPATWTQIPFFKTWHVDFTVAGVHPLRDLHHHRQLQRGEPDGRAGRARGRALGDRGGHLRDLRLRAWGAWTPRTT